MKSGWGVGALPLLDKMLTPGVLPAREIEALAAWTSPKLPDGSGVFFRFQALWVFEPLRFAICNKSRQIGLTFATAAWAVLRAMLFGETVAYVSEDRPKAIEALTVAENHAKVLVALGSRLAEHSRKIAELSFANGGRIIAFSADAAGRSFSGSVVLDEFAYHGNAAEAVWDAAAPVTRHNYQLRVLSTPNGIGNLFHEFWTNPESASKGWARYEFPYTRAIEDGMGLDVAELWKEARGDARVFAQMNECSFLDGVEQYIPSSLINAAQLEDCTVHFGDAYAGMDVGLRNDLSVIVVLRVTDDGRIWVQQIRKFKRTDDWDAQEQAVIETFEHWGCRRLCIDETGVGIVPAASLQKKLGRSKVEPVPFTLSSKEELATGLFQALSAKSSVDGLPMLRIPAAHTSEDAKALVAELGQLKRIITSAGNVRYDAERTDRGHADRAWSLALALHAISYHKSNKAVAERTRAVGLDQG